MFQGAFRFAVNLLCTYFINFYIERRFTFTTPSITQTPVCLCC